MQALLTRALHEIVPPLIKERDKWDQVQERLNNEMHEHKIDMETLGLKHALDIIEYSVKVEQWMPVVQKFPELKAYAELMQQYEQAGEEFKKLRPPPSVGGGGNAFIEEFWDQVARVFDFNSHIAELEIELDDYDDEDDEFNEAEEYIRSLGYFEVQHETVTHLGEGRRRKRTWEALTCKFIG
jgi:hypothetical protein